MPARFLCILEINRYGHLEVELVSERHARSVNRTSLYLQADYDVDAFLERLPARTARDARDGWPTRALLPVEYFGA